MLLDSTRQDRLQHMVIEAIADLREARAVPALATLLATGSPEIQRSAHWALVVLARTDYADNAAAWDEWWRVNSSRHRIEWLIDALMHESQEIRRAAGDELKSLTKEYFGYYDDLPARERERAQKRYRDWWDSKGKARFM
jgi:HEAT repeat protein